MTRLVLAAAQMMADDVDGWGMPILRALLPVAGMTVIEQQAERARAIGCERMLLLVDSLPAALVDAVDRIRGRGLAVDLVRSPADVAVASAGEERLILAADGLIAGESLWALVGLATAPVLLSASDSSVTQHMERIDSNSRWVGLACVGPVQLAELKTAPEDWDAQLLLLRNAVQCGVRREVCDAALFVTGAVALAQSSQGAADVEQQLLADEIRTEGGFAARWLLSPFLQLAAPLLLRRQDSGQIMRVLTILLAIGTAAGAVFHSSLAIAIVGFLAALCDQAGRFIARLRPETSLWSRIGAAGLIAQLLALTIADRGLTASDHWGSGACALTMLMVIAWLLDRKDFIRPGSTPDLGLVWIVAGIGTALLGWRGGFDLTTVIVGITLIVAIWKGNSGPKDGVPMPTA